MKHNCKVYEINPFIAKSWRSALSANGNKNNYGDAKLITIFSKNLKLQEISLKTAELKEKISAGDLPVTERTKLINSIKMLYYTRNEKLKFIKLKFFRILNFKVLNRRKIKKKNHAFFTFLQDNQKTIKQHVYMPFLYQKLTL